MEKKLERVHDEQDMLRADRRAESKRLENVYEQIFTLLKMQSEQQLKRFEEMRANEARERTALEGALRSRSLASTQPPQTRDDEETGLWTALTFVRVVGGIFDVLNSIT